MFCIRKGEAHAGCRSLSEHKKERRKPAFFRRRLKKYTKADRKKEKKFEYFLKLVLTIPKNSDINIAQRYVFILILEYFSINPIGCQECCVIC